MEDRLVKTKIAKNIKSGKCFWCGKGATFETWQFYNISSKNKDKHELCLWCSINCLSKAEGSPTKISNCNRGQFHIHKGKNTCFGEFYSQKRSGLKKW